MSIIKYDLKKNKAKKLKYKEVWGVRSDSNPSKIHVVCLNKKDVWSCGCPHWTRNMPRPECKHIKKIKKFREDGFVGLYVDQPLPAAVEEKLNRFSVAEV